MSEWARERTVGVKSRGGGRGDKARPGTVGACLCVTRATILQPISRKGQGRPLVRAEAKGTGRENVTSRCQVLARVAGAAETYLCPLSQCQPKYFVHKN